MQLSVVVGLGYDLHEDVMTTQSLVTHNRCFCELYLPQSNRSEDRSMIEEIAKVLQSPPISFKQEKQEQVRPSTLLSVACLSKRNIWQSEVKYAAEFNAYCAYVALFSDKYHPYIWVFSPGRQFPTVTYNSKPY